MKTIDVYQGKAVFSIGIFVVQNIPRVIISRDQPMPMQKDGKGHEIFAELALFGFIEFFYAGKGRIGEKTTKEISGVEDSSPVHMHVTDGSSRFNSAASQTQRIPIGSFGFGGTEEGVNETIEHGRARIFFDNHRDALIMRGDDRVATVAKYAIDRKILLRQSPDEIFKIGIIRMNDCFHARKIHVFFGFYRAKIGGETPEKRGKWPVCCSTFPGKRILHNEAGIIPLPTSTAAMPQLSRYCVGETPERCLKYRAKNDWLAKFNSSLICWMVMLVVLSMTLAWRRT